MGPYAWGEDLPGAPAVPAAAIRTSSSQRSAVREWPECRGRDRGRVASIHAPRSDFGEPQGPDTEKSSTNAAFFSSRLATAIIGGLVVSILLSVFVIPSLVRLAFRASPSSPSLTSPTSRV